MTSYIKQLYFYDVIIMKRLKKNISSKIILLE